MKNQVTLYMKNPTLNIVKKIFDKTKKDVDKQVHI